MNIHQRIAELTDLAKTCAEDGRFYTAANRLRELADEIDAHVSTITAAKRYDPGKVTVIKHREELVPQMPAPTNPHDRYSMPDPIEQHLKERNRRDTMKRAGVVMADAERMKANHASTIKRDD